ncbi:uncharacterized protein si:dkey-29h14.10 [Betta splendens]|uniref:Uncharacterized protein si:dkey-29h14.10 n=1 Tax=Betta splendens TaxID=158456 RepID=A0A8M1H2H8_BETSP|nr:uncharacterized protein si:dkey-29h14.10 [Betta splendens]
MANFDPFNPSPVNNSCLTKTRESTSTNQVMSLKAFSMQRLVQLVQKSSRRACQLFCCPLDALLCEKPACCPGSDSQPTAPKTAQVALTSPPSTILILNISNSTLIDCVIGPDTYASAAAESHSLMQEPALHVHDKLRCSCSNGHQGSAPTSPTSASSCVSSQEPPSINIHGSHLNYVIIGDNNYMHAEHVAEAEAPLL